ncbi:divergent polysaccharide deacetylase family protein [Brevundimonas sp. S30B]|uniref:divergent polysaccharide deacetylase family protein n=1 Tax=unclassified Brevundimonas TaxID=2622653 RepID=UPI0010716752|nr:MULTISPECIES: divergent polysaccharide deacetylase family protein [unclassified Brevundimonas]QBX36596.1 divergent polysaccharide deacetylase family protein [Brevundimonas sp. MF30-B]TFW00895.1 divergent polysaccharide deacetylase family protein [Brevundimonas sp. S30B]
MFAKRQSALAAAAGSPPPKASLNLAPVVAILKKPPVAVAAAGGLLLAAGALFVAVLGDPRAGAPSARGEITRDAVSTAPPSGFEAFFIEGMDPYQALIATDPLSAGVEGGEALITLPDGAVVSGGVPVGAPRRAADPLAPAPIAGLSQPGPDGPLPVIATDGRVPAQAYARPFRSNGKPRVALIVGGLGLNAVTTRAAIERLPAEVTLSFVPYADNLQSWIDQARAQGHEVLIEMPMEPSGYPDNDPGPYTLLASGGADDVTAKMNWLLGRATGYFGVTNYLGDRFMASDAGMNAFLSVLRQRGVAFLDDGSAGRRPGAWARASADRVIDQTQSPAAIMAQLNAIEALAKSRGSAMGAGFSYPVTVEAAARWAEGLDARGLQLAPASAMTQRPGR